LIVAEKPFARLDNINKGADVFFLETMGVDIGCCVESSIVPFQGLLCSVTLINISSTLKMVL